MTGKNVNDINDDFEDFDPRDLPPSKSQLKRESAELQALGDRLIDLPPTQLAQLPFFPTLFDAVHIAQKIRNKRVCYRRQLQYIGKLMRLLDTDVLQQALAELD